MCGSSKQDLRHHVKPSVGRNEGLPVSAFKPFAKVIEVEVNHRRGGRPMNDDKLSTAGSFRPPSTNFCCFSTIAREEMVCGAWEIAWMIPVSCTALSKCIAF